MQYPNATLESCLNQPLHTHKLKSLSDVISREKFLSFQIATAGDGNNIYCVLANVYPN
jgi:hypothetical protein